MTNARPLNPLQGKTLPNSNGCHVWQRATNSRGYAVVWFDGKVRLAHRVAFYLRHGRWPLEGLVIDHACDTKACVNADHLREMENWRNIRRAYPIGTPDQERVRASNRRAHAKQRGTYSASWVAERTE